MSAAEKTVYGEPCHTCDKPIIEVPWYSSGYRWFCSETCRDEWRVSKGFQPVKAVAGDTKEEEATHEHHH